MLKDQANNKKTSNEIYCKEYNAYISNEIIKIVRNYFIILIT